MGIREASSSLLAKIDGQILPDRPENYQTALLLTFYRGQVNTHIEIR